MFKIRCVERQAAKSFFKGAVFAECVNCRQGREIKEELTRAGIKEIPHIETDHGRNPAGDVMENTVLKICKKCGQEKPLDRDHFYGDQRTKDGFANVCLECDGRTEKNRRSDPYGERQAGENGKNPDMKEILKLMQGRQDLIPDLVEAADRDFRTPEQQAAYYIERGLKVDRVKETARQGK